MLDTLDTPPAAADPHARLRYLERESIRLRALVQSLYDAGHVRPLVGWSPVQHPAARMEWRQCEFCGCNTNAAERLCCATGRRADRQSWDPTE
jgi:hypothetical protein